MLRCRHLGITLEMDRDWVWRFRSLARAYYIRTEYDGDFRRVAVLPRLTEADGGEPASKWLRAALIEATARDGMTLRIIEPAPTADEISRQQGLGG